MRLGEFIGTARMLSIYGRKYDVIFKYIEINSLGQNSRGLYHNKPASDFNLLTKLATFSSTWSLWILHQDRIQKVQIKLTPVKNFLMLLEDLYS